ncbi:hypothetical protein J4434_05185 [Candidatus Woesearchaeota archaeon]|nr:hypothetical protein [Candidatus Woesearchaeota archaeon]
MQIPDVPTVPIDLDDNTKDFLESLEGRLDVNEITAVKVDDSTVYVLAYNNNIFVLEYNVIELDRKTGRVTENSFTNWKFRAVKEFDKKKEEYKRANLKDAEEKVKDIKIYQGSTEEVAKRLGRSLEEVDTHKPETFVRSSDSLMLRIRVYQLGGEAIVHYQNNPIRYNPNYCIGTPVKYAATQANCKRAA